MKPNMTTIGYTENDWPEDWKHENGMYENKCCNCHTFFIGYKRRFICKVCGTKDENMTNKFKIGDRVQATQNAGFHKGAKGVINYIEPSGKCWVRRDHASTDVFYEQDELELLPEKKQRNRERVMDILQEECAEVIQAISKIRRFGLDEKWQGVTNKQSLITEIGDVMAIIGILMDETDINITEADIKKAIEAKEKKLEIFLPYE